MPPTTITPLLQAFVQKIRADAPLHGALTGGEHEGTAPESTQYPFLTYQVHYAPHDRDHTNVTTRVGLDVLIHSRDQVEARNLAQALSDLLIGVSFDFTATEHGDQGQSTLFADVDQELYDSDIDGEGQKVYSVGALFEFWMDQPRSA